MTELQDKKNTKFEEAVIAYLGNPDGFTPLYSVSPDTNGENVVANVTAHIRAVTTFSEYLKLQERIGFVVDYLKLHCDIRSNPIIGVNFGEKTSGANGFQPITFRLYF